MALDATLRQSRLLQLPSFSTVTYVLLNALGLLAYLHPFNSAGAQPDSRWFEHNTDAPLVFAGVAALSMVLIVSELTRGGLNSKSLAALGVLAAMAAVLRTITLPAGANLYFFMVILGAHAFGPRLGFLLGALSFFLSAVVTGGIGPWLPFQMFASAWIGLAAGFLGIVARRASLPPRAEVALAVGFGAVSGIIFGAITNLWFWPFWVGGSDVTYQPGIGVAEAVRRYWNFYLVELRLGRDAQRLPRSCLPSWVARCCARYCASAPASRGSVATCYDLARLSSRRSSWRRKQRGRSRMPKTG
jgi:energy-coupling factor transport system substrate-specific component